LLFTPDAGKEARTIPAGKAASQRHKRQVVMTRTRKGGKPADFPFLGGA